ncbi:MULTISPECIES: helix-turn-helix domain-containing protein [unclassified Streptomyces]|uniref:helix-turn-helix domain-containing protein n=1 Tax=unclassified Streptomyces TaxID=2593676 RepID=UPI0029AF93DC|nr:MULTISPECIES: helix-turn-helix domain-containing protein [unclassified Streptomyces]MDX3772085.1 helix-turn-helix domain-containing protein [Streptomyces sp. AK08-01B]MDX3821610.1 helix-turn-helix domain-containing protein [Streptomyces sp. AK08-01A]
MTVSASNSSARTVASSASTSGSTGSSTEGGASIRAIADAHGRSYGFVHRMLSEAGVTLRGRGGATRNKPSS